VENNRDGKWIGPLVRAEVERLRMNGEARAQFDATVKKITDLEDEATIRRMLYDIFGSHSYCVEVPRG
jgi:hypothetical protein